MASAAKLPKGSTKVTLRTVKATGTPVDQHLEHIQRATQEALDKLAAQVDASAVGPSVPIGGIVFVDLTMKGVPTPGPNFQKCDGKVIADQRSPMVGQNTRNLISGGTGGVGYFLRSGATSGVTQASNIKDHVHSFTNPTYTASNSLTLPNHVHSTGGLTSFFITGGATLASGSTGGAAQVSNTGNPTTNPAIPGSITVSLNVSGSVGSINPPGGSETIPENMSMVPYVRIW